MTKPTQKKDVAKKSKQVRKTKEVFVENMLEPSNLEAPSTQNDRLEIDSKGALILVALGADKNTDKMGSQDRLGLFTVGERFMSFFGAVGLVIFHTANIRHRRA